MSQAVTAMLDGKARWLLWPVLQANALVVIPAAVYGLATVHVDLASTGRAATYAVLIVMLVAAAFLFRSQSKVRTLRYLANGRLPGTPQHLLAAIIEVRALPEWLMAATMTMWLAASAAVAAGSPSVAAVSSADQLRIASLALTFGPVAGALVYLLATRRVRALVEQIATKVPVQDVLAALSSEKKRQVRVRLVIFTAIVVVLPAVVVADATRVNTIDVLTNIALAPRGQQPEVARTETRVAVAQVLALASLLGGLALLAAFLAGKNLAEPMRHVAEEANRISRGDLKEVRLVAAEDEVWIVASTFTQMQSQLQSIIAQLQKAGISIGSTTEELMATSSKYESGAADQASSLNETSATTEELAQSARQIAHNAGSVSDLAQKTFEAARAGQDSAAAFVAAVERMKHDNHSIAEAVTRLQKRVQQIGRIVEFITTVADRSDLLALSAELEGTKAGDVGRGFTLVAAEMRRLAENVIESTNEIEELIGEIREATLATVGATARGMEHTESGTALAGAVSGALQQVVALAQSTSDSVRAISLATQQQQSSTDQLAEAMADILGITQQSLAATKQVTSANHELIALSGDLKSLVDRFQTTRAQG